MSNGLGRNIWLWSSTPRALLQLGGIVSVKRTKVIKCGMINNKQKSIDNTPEGLFHYTRTLHFIKSNKSLVLSHHHSTSALVSEILTSVLQTVQKKQQQQFTYAQYVFTDCTEDNVQNTHTYTQYTQCTIKTYLVIDPHYTLYVHIYIMYTSIHSIMWRCNRLYIYSRWLCNR